MINRRTEELHARLNALAAHREVIRLLEEQIRTLALRRHDEIKRQLERGWYE